MLSALSFVLALALLSPSVMGGSSRWSVPIVRQLPGGLAQEREEPASSCYPGFVEDSNPELSICCWYNSYSCCTHEVQPELMPMIRGNLTWCESQEISEGCLIVLSELICLSCAPHTSSFVTPLSPASYQISICISFCNAMLQACKYDKIPNKAASSSTGAEFCSALFNGNPSLTISHSNTSCFGGVPLAQVQGSTCYHPHGGDGSSSPSTDDSLLSALVGITATLVVLVALLIIGLLAVTFCIAYRKWREHNWLWRTEPDDPDDIPMEEMSPQSSTPDGGSSPPVQLYLSRSGGVPIHISEPLDDEEKTN